jgi:hypothetical protein
MHSLGQGHRFKFAQFQSESLILAYGSYSYRETNNDSIISNLCKPEVTVGVSLSSLLIMASNCSSGIAPEHSGYSNRICFKKFTVQKSYNRFGKLGILGFLGTRKINNLRIINNQCKTDPDQVHHLFNQLGILSARFPL